jgi:hypothetical protein
MPPPSYKRGGVQAAIGQRTTIQVPPKVIRARMLGMHFEVDKNFLLPKAMKNIRSLVSFYDEHTGFQVLIVGHADASGPFDYNRELSLERAAAIKAFLTEDVAAWSDRYKASVPGNKRWGVREDQYMLSALDDGETRFYKGPINGILNALTQAAVEGFQGWSDEHRGTALIKSSRGKLDDATRKELITVYMELDGTTLPAGTTVQTHGCGRTHLFDKAKPFDEVNRRVDIFLFDTVIAPAPQALCPIPGGCAEYAQWELETIKEVNFELKPRPTVYKIHPAIGFARVGDSPSEFFIGPEIPGVPSLPHAGAKSQTFRDAAHRIKRQAARFRIYEYEAETEGADVGALCEVREISLDWDDVQSIKWTVHLANRKASFKRLQNSDPLTDEGILGDITIANVNPDPRSDRNASVTGAARATQLEIDPGPRSISGREASPVEFDKGSSAQPGKETWPTFKLGARAGQPVITTLGTLRTDKAGHLLVLGGHGTSMSRLANPANPALDEFANNDHWFDDVSDGPVTAEITFKGEKGTVVVGGWTEAACFAGAPVAPSGAQAQAGAGGGAWLICGPPDFAPHIGNVITLHERLYDVAAQKLTLDKNVLYHKPKTGRPPGLWRLADFKASPGSYAPSYAHEIFPILWRTFQMAFVAGPVGLGTHNSVDPLRWAMLGLKATPQADRNRIVRRLRLPPERGASSGAQDMPQLLGDANGDVDDKGNKKPHGPEAKLREFLALTETQLAMLEHWRDGNFDEDWPGHIPTPASTITPDGLDQAALENGVGGAFFPGIEIGWQCRNPEVYAEPFRIKLGNGQRGDVLRAGYFSRQMALPWQADFFACASDGTNGWWPGQRPDTVFKTPKPAASSDKTVPWARVNDADTTDIPDWDVFLVQWQRMGFVVDVTDGQGTEYREIDRAP